MEPGMTGGMDPAIGRPGDGHGHEAGDELKGRAADVTRRARGRAMETIDHQKGELSGLLDRVADTIQDDRMGSYAADLARQGARFLRGRSTDEIVSSARAELTTRPAAFLSLSFLAGFAIARLARR